MTGQAYRWIDLMLDHRRKNALVSTFDNHQFRNVRERILKLSQSFVLLTRYFDGSLAIFGH